MLTEIEIEALIKKRKITKNLMPWFIRGLILEQLEDSEDSSFKTGYGEGQADEADKWESLDLEDIPGVDLIKYDFAIETLKETININEKIKELEIERCRLL